MRRLFWFLALLLVAVGAWMWITPRRTYDRFLRAVAFGDRADLEATVDFPVLRDNLRRDLRSRLAAGPARIAGEVAASLLGTMVDAAVTPEGLSSIVTGFGTAPGGVSPDSLHRRTTTSFRYRSLSRVDVRIRPAGDERDGGGVLSFERTGLRWRLVRAWAPRPGEPG